MVYKTVKTGFMTTGFTTRCVTTPTGAWFKTIEGLNLEPAIDEYRAMRDYILPAMVVKHDSVNKEVYFCDGNFYAERYPQDELIPIDEIEYYWFAAVTDNYDDDVLLEVPTPATRLLFKHRIIEDFKNA